MDVSRNEYRVLIGRPEGIRPLGRPRRRWEYNMQMDLREVGYDGRDWINLAQDRDRWWAYVRGGNEPPASLKAIKKNWKLHYIFNVRVLRTARYPNTQHCNPQSSKEPVLKARLLREVKYKTQIESSRRTGRKEWQPEIK
ncbi:hypothetical protein ANN_19368 [Periplaneta americana]|uniref:Uncharacterized protein n=1 Tax=Periplaneta americana TaxID=6978 RepID=A0ABQ8SAP0_PERAM|nr:hypothetical protein ANN_19368 [Periplaneta americana]